MTRKYHPRGAHIAWTVLAVGTVALAVFGLVTNPAALGGVIALGLGSAVVLGIAIRTIRAPHGKRLREGLGPAAGAAEAYQQLLMSREPTEISIQRAFADAEDDRATDGP